MKHFETSMEAFIVTYCVTLTNFQVYASMPEEEKQDQKMVCTKEFKKGAAMATTIDVTQEFTLTELLKAEGVTVNQRSYLLHIGKETRSFIAKEPKIADQAKEVVKGLANSKYSDEVQGFALKIFDKIYIEPFLGSNAK